MRAGLGVIALFATGVAACVATAADAPDAEYAVRWDPAEGGPRTAADVLRLLELGKAEVHTFEVRYYDAPVSASTPESARVILRERERDGDEDEILVKFRRATPLTADWTCPLGGRAERSAQVDVGFGPGDTIARTYSYSCELEADSFPPSLRATPHPCSITFTRATAKKIKIETWPLPSGDSLLEVSHVARDSQKELANFQKIVARLIAAGAHPKAESKTELAGACR